MTRIALTCQDLYARGYSSGKSDAFNGFNEASRQAMLDAIRRECGTLLKLFWMARLLHELDMQTLTLSRRLIPQRVTNGVLTCFMWIVRPRTLTYTTTPTTPLAMPSSG